MGRILLVNRLLTTAEVAQMLRVSQRTVNNWIRNEAIPYVALPQNGSKREYRIPLNGLLNSLSGTYDLASQLDAIAEYEDQLNDARERQHPDTRQTDVVASASGRALAR
jgi:excisionase family DNA binding protein